ncbi:molybdenum cofactor guanylyltransferase [Methanobacterium alcaliphilum]|uniref:molybdenum cofactor guanylyltransferase n=1 Tax=Methanobacterium alcaliphilum TaxID=392018 RepID=UPI0031838750
MLCGGMSTRMGQDKGQMLFNEKPMIINILETVENHADEVVLVLRDEKQINIYKSIIEKYESNKLGFNLKIVKDEIKNQGPLIGIITGLKYVKSDYALVLPCDSPLISAVFVENIFNAIEKSKEYHDTVVPKWDSGDIEPLHSIYPQKSQELVKSLLSNGKKDVKSLIKLLNVYFIKVEKLDPSKSSFKNFNNPKDIEKYLK